MWGKGNRGDGLAANSQIDVTVTNAPSNEHAKTNCGFISSSPSDPLAHCAFVELGSCVFTVRPDAAIAPGSLGLNAVQRKCVRVSGGDRVAVRPFEPPAAGFQAALVTAEVAPLAQKRAAAAAAPLELDAPELAAHLLARFAGQVVSQEQVLTFEYQGTNFLLTVAGVLVAGAEGGGAARGMLAPATAFVFQSAAGAGITVKGQRGGATPQLFKHKEVNFERLGIGGLDAQFEAIFRRAFASRVFPPSVVERLGIRHVKGVLLHGPPGTGKTLIARQIGKMLNGREPKVVNGPEVLNKYVGASEENIRKLFVEAEAEEKAKGAASELHVIIFDEIDAICKSRGSVRDGSGVHDTVVNQLLTKIDGVDALNNILLIGMTNRKDMLDEALLRPGRLEIHTGRMSTNSFLGRDVDLFKLAQRCRNFSGAEIEGLVKSAASFALNRQVDLSDLSKPIDEENLKVGMEDFESAIAEIKPAFGAVTETLAAYVLNGMIDFGEPFRHLLATCQTLVEQVRSSEHTPLLTALLEGPAGAGKTALAATLGLESQFPLVKVVSSDAMVGFSEPAKAAQIAKVFEDAYRSPMSIVVLDDIERLLEYVPIGPRFSNGILQALLVLVKKQPPEGRRLLVIGTSSAPQVMADMGLADAFNVALHVPAVRDAEVATVLKALNAFEPSQVGAAVAGLAEAEVPIKRLLLLVDLARQGVPAGAPIPLERWHQVLRDLALN
ncbi:hypothetical protein WJX81_007964 [Elliptochloris bilobata]|uniref:Vesicle-fusing ATPase n=1 Tax=Elliptochloris bilobata TaxID=381761 RepID=A0AAW1S5Y8_9CHLO